MYYPEDLIEEIRLKNDIVDVISGYVLSTVKNPLLFPCQETGRCIIALAAMQGERYLTF